MKLEGKVALVTGAARRVGRAISVQLARAGCTVAAHYLRSEADTRATVAACREFGAQAEAFRADLADPPAAANLVESVLGRFGRLDVLINNAATFGSMPLEGFDPERWEHTLRVNLTAPLVLIHAARKALKQARGRVVNLCDAATDRPWPDHLAYIVSKGGLETLTRALARSLAPDVNVVGVAPGVAQWPDDYDDETRRRLEAKIPLTRCGSPDDVAAAVLYLLRDGDYVTGSILRVDGGRGLV